MRKEYRQIQRRYRDTVPGPPGDSKGDTADTASPLILAHGSPRLPSELNIARGTKLIHIIVLFEIKSGKP